ncbi:MAG: GGDEF domain-containing protein [Pseudomonadota bacterium]
MQIDVRTLIVVGAVMCAVMGLLFGLAGRRLPPDERASIRIWVGGLFLQPLAWGLFAARGAIHDLLSVVLANTLLMLALCECARAMRRYLGLSERRAWLWSMPIVVAMVVWWFSSIVPHYSLRVIVMSAGTGFALAMMASALLPALRSGGSVPGRMVFWLSFVGIVIVAARVVRHIRHPQPDGSLFEAAASDALALGYAATAPVFMSLGFLLMHHERAYRQMHAMATVDALTGVLSRGALEAQGKRALHENRRSGRPISLLMIDVDHFKRINDMYGHAAGDEVLRRIAARIRSQMREDDLVGRIGGEEFLALLPGTTGEQAHAVATRIHRCVRAEPVEYLGLALTATVSVGVIEATDDGADWSALLTRADDAMYDAKRAGRDRVVLTGEPAIS